MQGWTVCVVAALALAGCAVPGYEFGGRPETDSEPSFAPVNAQPLEGDAFDLPDSPSPVATPVPPRQSQSPSPPTSLDRDRDGLSNEVEMSIGTDPAKADSDGDGWGDAVEWGLIPNTCAGLLAALHRDSDLDGLPDPSELQPGAWCNPDMDTDGLKDGLEPADCRGILDCDDDGLLDGAEAAAGIQNPTSLGGPYPDGWVQAAKARGLPAPNASLDADPIPDNWETLPLWGGFHPIVGERDLLVEVVYVLGPETARYATAAANVSDLEPVAAFFQANKIHFEASIHVVVVGEDLDAVENNPVSPIPGLSPQGRNPFVTKVYLGRGMQFAAAGVAGPSFIDLHGAIMMLQDNVDDSIHIGPYQTYSPRLLYNMLEAKGANETVPHDNGGIQLWLDNGTVHGRLTADHGTDFPRGTTFEYEGRTPKQWRIQYPDGNATTLNLTAVADFDLRTFTHELGHLFGLCHTHETECHDYLNLTEEERGQQWTSTMSYNGGSGLHFLQTEWGFIHRQECPIAYHQVMQYLTDYRWNYLGANRVRCFV